MATTATTGSAGSCNWKERFAAGTRADTDVLVSGGKAGTEAEAELASDKRWSNPRLSDRALVGGGNGQPHGELPRRIRRKVPANRRKLQADEVEDQDDMDQDVNLLNKEKENLRLQLALKTKELELEEIRRLKLELVLKTKENESLLKQNDELKAENEQLKNLQSHQKLEGFAGRVRVMNSMTPATAPRSHKRLGLLKKRSLTDSARWLARHILLHPGIC